jgi:pyrroline-5-carboxylate reductase
MPDNEPRFGFLGAGKMATALAQGWLAAGLASAARSLASDPLPQAREAFTEATGIRTTASNREVAAGSDLLVLAVKPQSMKSLLAEIQPAITADHLIVSIAAGVTLRQLAEGLGPGRRLVRVMPNTPCLVGASASAYSPAPTATPQDAALVDRLLNAVGRRSSM